MAEFRRQTADNKLGESSSFWKAPMTKSKRNQNSGPTKLQKNLRRIREIANALEQGIQLPKHVMDQFIDQLWAIGEGKDANEAFDIKAGRGERRQQLSYFREWSRRYALAWIARKVAGGTTLEDAIDMVAIDSGFRLAELGDDYQFTRETLHKYWTDYPALRNPIVNTPYEFRPLRTPLN